MSCEHCGLEDRDGWHSPGWCFDWLREPGPELPEQPSRATAPVVVDKALRDSRYRTGICTDCGRAPHSAGRPRCLPCHDQWQSTQLPEPALNRRRIEPCALCARPGAVPGKVLCGPCTRAQS